MNPSRAAPGARADSGFDGRNPQVLGLFRRRDARNAGHRGKGLGRETHPHGEPTPPPDVSAHGRGNGKSSHYALLLFDDATCAALLK